jgi:hypothetical protein
MITETSQIEREPRSGGTALLLIISAATIVTVAAEAAFIHWASWALLPLIVLGIVGVAAGVVAAVGRLVDDGEIAAPARSAATPETDPRAAEPSAVRLPALGH